MGAWRWLDPERAGELAGARVELHWAAQIPCAAARDAPLLAWSSAHEALLGRTLDVHGTRAGLRPRDLALVVARGTELVSEHVLQGRTLTQALRWLASELTRHGDDRRALARPIDALPDHPVAHGAPFTLVGGGALAVLTDWIADAHELLDALRRAHGASEVCCTPERLALASSIASGAGTIEAGVSLGDELEPAPHLYVAPTSIPTNARDLPPLTAGARWRTERSLVAILSGAALARDAAAQRAQASAFFERAITSCRALR